MLRGRVLGTATSTVKHPSMEGWRLLVVQPFAADEKSPDGEPLLAIDGQGARRRDTVILSSDGRGTRELVGDENTPVRWSVLGIEDE